MVCYGMSDTVSSTTFHLLDCLHKCMKTYHSKKLLEQTVFLMMKTLFPEHVEDTKT